MVWLQFVPISGTRAHRQSIKELLNKHVIQIWLKNIIFPTGRTLLLLLKICLSTSVQIAQEKSFLTSGVRDICHRQRNISGKTHSEQKGRAFKFSTCDENWRVWQIYSVTDFCTWILWPKTRFIHRTLLIVWWTPFHPTPPLCWTF